VSLPVAVIAGGLATRLRPLTERVPKILLDIEGRPFAEHQVELLRSQGVTDVVFCLGHLGEMVEAALGDGSRWGMRFQYSFDGPRLVGTGGALLRALPWLGSAFFVLYGDSYLECNFAAVEAAFRSGGRPALMTVFRNDDRFDRSNVVYEDGRILRYHKRGPDPDMHHIDYGLAVLSPSVLDGFTAIDGPLDLATIYQTLVEAGQMTGFEVFERFYEIGSLDGLEQTRQRIARRGGQTA